MSVAETARRIRDGELSPREAVESYLERIERLDGSLNAYIAVRADQALAEADQVPDGPLRGVPVAVKDVIDVAGVPTHGGGRAPIDPSPKRHARVVERLLQAGWTAVGKTHTVELAYGSWGTNRAVGAPWNPWDADVHRAPGGSSSGSGVAVAAGLCDAALGTDTGGSVRIPAAVCGIVGLKPGRGLVSLEGVHPLSPALDTVGALARSVPAAARMLAAMSGPDGAAAVRDPFDAEGALKAPARGRRVAAIPVDRLTGLHPEVARVYRAALDRLREAGVAVEMAPPLSSLEESFAPNGLLMAGEGWRLWRERIAAQGPSMDPWIVRRFQAGRDFTDRHLQDARARRAADQAEFHAWMAPFDALVSPTCPIPAPPLEGVDETTSPLSQLTRAANYLDLPGISVPAGLTADGLPVGLQILGRPADEASVVTLGAAFEQVSGWDARAPDLAGFAA